ncbi:hypothetical protein BS78_02G120000 [Paspalum vaginatum]|nr:hypothetical protein BS78_02G120000 [Paspalum vaginatum]
MDAPSDDGSPPRIRRQLQGPRPPRLRVQMESHTIKKGAVTPRSQSHQLQRPPAQPQHPQQPQRSTAIIAALSPSCPAAMLPAVERVVRPLPSPSNFADSFVSADAHDSLAPVLSPLSPPGILSSAALPLVASSGQFSSLPFHPSWLALVWPSDLGDPLLNQPRRTLLPLTPATVSAVPQEFFSFISNVPNIKLSIHGEGGSPARQVADAEQHGEAEAAELAGDPQLGVDSGPIVRRLFQQLVHVRTAISISSTSGAGSLPSHSWFNGVKHLCSDAQESLEHLHYLMILKILGAGKQHEKVMANVPGTHSKTTSTSRSIQPLLPSPEELAISSVTDKLFKAIGQGSHGWLSGAALCSYSDVSSLTSLLKRCILLCRGILGIINSKVCAEGMKKTPELPVFAFDDLTYTGHSRGTGMDTHSMPAQVIDPICLSPIFITSILYLDLSSCSGLTQLPPSISNLPNLAALNLSHCRSLHTLPVSLGELNNLQMLVLSCCSELRNLPVSLCELSKVRLLDLAGCSRLEKLPASFVNLGHLENLNLSDCKELKELPQSLGNLQKLKYLNLSGCHGVDLDVESLCTLTNLKDLTLSPLTNIQGFPGSFKDLANHLDRLGLSKKNLDHPHCIPKAASLHTYKCYEDNIIDMLLSDEGGISSDQVVTSVCIVGDSGMGKTELVRRIYSNEMVLDAFDLRMWAYMFDKKRLLGKILEFTTCAHCSDAPISVLEEIVIEELMNKRLLLVLEDSDMKSTHFWDYLQSLLNVCSKGSALIVTTTSKEAANLMGAMQTFYLDPLSKQECFMIFKEHVLEGLDMNNYCQLEKIGWKFVEKCGGNPMCIKALNMLF